MIADEPRVRDVELGAALGYAKPENVRGLITKLRDYLARFGPLAVAGSGRTTEYLLNRGQVTYVIMSCRQKQAAAAPWLTHIIRVFTARQKGKLMEVDGRLVAVDLETAVYLQDSFEEATARVPAIGELYGRLGESYEPPAECHEA